MGWLQHPIPTAMLDIIQFINEWLDPLLVRPVGGFKGSRWRFHRCSLQGVINLAVMDHPQLLPETYILKREQFSSQLHQRSGNTQKTSVVHPVFKVVPLFQFINRKKRQHKLVWRNIIDQCHFRVYWTSSSVHLVVRDIPESVPPVQKKIDRRKIHYSLRFESSTWRSWRFWFEKTWKCERRAMVKKH